MKCRMGACHFARWRCSSESIVQAKTNETKSKVVSHSSHFDNQVYRERKKTRLTDSRTNRERNQVPFWLVVLIFSDGRRSTNSSSSNDTSRRRGTV
ncbi:hypothetical protein ACA910_009524 [Epithemia clementina (nom. ined.)]